VQLRRVKGYRKPEGAVNVARPTKWGNPIKVIAPRTAEGAWAWKAAVRIYERMLRSGELPVSTKDVKAELRGKDLACYCPLDRPCHADVLLKVANK
jgi:hypothetical protein